MACVYALDHCYLHILTHPLVRFIPDWFPGAGIKRLPPGTREDLQTFLHVPFNQVKKQMVRPRSPEFSTNVIHSLEYTRRKEQPYLHIRQLCWRRPKVKMMKVFLAQLLLSILVVLIRYLSTIADSLGFS